jgi:MSHA biogenesis protein MshL
MRRLLSGSIVAWVGIAFVGCATPTGPAPEPEPVADETPAELAEPPPEVSAALVPPVGSLGLASRDAAGDPRFDVSVNEAPMREFLGSLVDGTPYDIVVHPDVEGTVSLHLRRVTVAEVLEAVREIAPIDYRGQGRVFFVGPATLQTRTFRVDYLNVSRGGRSETRVSSGQVSEGARSADDGGVDQPIVTGDTDRGAVVGSRVSTDSRVDFWAELDATLRAMVGGGPERSVMISPHTGLVVVRAAPLELRDVARYLDDVQHRIGKEVILEAKVLEVVLSDGFQAGINWAQIGDAVIAAQTGGGSLIKDGISEIAGNLGNLNPDLGDLPDGTDTSAFGGAFSLAIDTDDFKAFVELLETQGDVHVLSNPRIATVSNQKAVIKVGSDEFFVTDVSSTTVTGTATTTTPDITLTPFFSGIALDVTPQIGVDDDVTLHIHPSVSDVQDQTKEITIAGETQRLPLAFSTIRESDSVVRAKSGQVVVIGGLIEDGSRNDRAGLPWLDRIPYAGAVFRQTATDAKRRELVILLKPLVVDDEVWENELQAAESRVDELRPGAARLLRDDPLGRPRKPAPW